MNLNPNIVTPLSRHCVIRVTIATTRKGQFTTSKSPRMEIWRHIFTVSVKLNLYFSSFESVYFKDDIFLGFDLHVTLMMRPTLLLSFQFRSEKLYFIYFILSFNSPSLFKGCLLQCTAQTWILLHI